MTKQEYFNGMKDLITKMIEEIARIYDLKISKGVRNITQMIGTLNGVVMYKGRNHYDSRSWKTSDSTFMITLPDRYLSDGIDHRFEVAQALGHLILHMGFLTNDERWESMPVNKPHDCKNWAEQEEANLFANCLLMPEKHFREVVEEYTEGDKIDTTTVARYFNVSISQAHHWGVQLGIFRPDF